MEIQKEELRNLTQRNAPHLGLDINVHQQNLELPNILVVRIGNNKS